MPVTPPHPVGSNLPKVSEPSGGYIAPPLDWAAVRDEAADLLSRLIQFDTSNPPGHESLVAEFLADLLSAEGIGVKLLAATPGRANLVARLPGDGSRPPLLLLGHTDVVYAEADQWRVPPFSGTIRDGYVWGRGALDMKGLLAMQVMALRLVKRLGLPLARDLVLLATADEEDTGRDGAAWVVDQHWYEVAAEYVFGEGGVGVELDGRPVYLVATAEKGYADLTLTARGLSSHASTPGGGNALVALAQAIQRISTYRSGVHLTEPVKSHLAALAPALPWLDQRLLGGADLPLLSGWLVDRLDLPTIRHALRNTFTPTMAQAGHLANVVPDTAEATLNCRTLPGVGLGELLGEVRRRLAGLPVEVGVRQFNPASASPTATPFFTAIAEAARRETPGAIVAPYMMPGATDARFFRAKGVTAYGLMPVCLTSEEMATIHGVDERLQVRHLEQGTRAVFRLLQHMAARP